MNYTLLNSSMMRHNVCKEYYQRYSLVVSFSESSIGSIAMFKKENGPFKMCFLRPLTAWAD